MEQLTQIILKLESMDSKINLLGTSIRGDDSTGLKGVKQHIEELNNDFKEHTAADHEAFGNLAKSQTETAQVFSKAKWWLGGATFVVSAVVVIVGVAIKFIK
jgi:hypothetical protein